MSIPEIRIETSQPGMIAAIDGGGQVMVRAQRHVGQRKWSVLVNTSPRKLPDMMTATGDEQLVGNLVQLLVDGIDARGWH